jgi:hypothetical protein
MLKRNKINFGPSVQTNSKLSAHESTNNCQFPNKIPRTYDVYGATHTV